MNVRYPEVCRRQGELFVVLPYAPGNREWLESLGTHPRWNREHTWWELSAKRFRKLVAMLAQKYETVYVTDHVRATKSAGQCDVRCREALGDECVCRCDGAYHGMGWAEGQGWKLVGDTTLVEIRSQRFVERRWIVTSKELGRNANELSAGYRQGESRATA
jgi:hypothetical protein